MSKILRFLTCLFCIVFIGDAVFAAGYECPTYREYTTCNEGYYLAYSYTGTSYNSIRYYSTPRAGNACRPCTDYDTYYNKPEGSYSCAGGTNRPVLSKVTVTYNLNGGSGTAPSATTCEPNKSCTLASGATNSFYRAGYVFKGWSKSSSGVTNGSTSLLFSDDDIVYAVWVACDAGMYKPSTANANATCSSCPELGEGFEYVPSSGLTSMAACQQRLKDISLYNENCVNNSGDATAVVLCQASENGWDQCAALPISLNILVAGPGAYLNNEVLSEDGLQYNIPYANLSEILSQACIECSAGTYSPGGAVTSCSACPQPTDGFEYVPTTGNTSLTACKQGLKNPADINEFCEAASGTTAEELKIQCWAASDGTWGDCIRTGFPFDAKPGCYVGIPSQSQSMPVEDVVENICIQCTDGTYSEGGGASSCWACPALTTADERDGWKISTGGDGATSPQDCYAYLESYPTNCASGSFKRMLLGGGTGYYGSQWFELEPLRANPGYRVDFEDGQTTAPACVECSAGTYSPGGDVHSCSACPDLPTGFAYDPGTGLTDITQCYALATNMAAVDSDCRNVAWDMGLRVTSGASSDWDALRTDPVPTGMPALAGTYVNPDMVADTAWKSINGFNADDLCLPCPDGTYNDGQTESGKVATECTACPGSTHPKLDALPVSTGGTGATSHRQCYKYIRLAEVDSNCVSGEVRYRSMTKIMENSMNYEPYPIPAQDPALAPVAAPGHAVYLPNDPTTPSCIECDAGTYSAGGTVYSCTACPTGYDDNPETGLTSADMCQISCPGGYYLAAANDATCSEVSPGYWAAEKIVNYGDTSTRTECASGLTTIGYGAGADEAADCGRVLHFGDDTLYLRSAKKTDHALHVGINGTVFYGNMGTRIKLGDTTYSVYDDSM